jgi:acetolactate decarboxylase
LAAQGNLKACDLDVLHKMEDNFSEKLLASNPKNIFIIDEILNFNWNPVLKNTFIKTDILNKQKPNCK